MIENVSTQLTVFHCFAHCLLPGRAFASLYVLLFLEKEAEIGGREAVSDAINSHVLTGKTPCINQAINVLLMHGFYTTNISEYDQEIPQSQTADKPMAPRGRATKQSQDSRKTN